MALQEQLRQVQEQMKLLVEESSRRGKEKKRTKRKRDKDKERLLMLQGLGGVLGTASVTNNAFGTTTSTAGGGLPTTGAATPLLPTAAHTPLLKGGAVPSHAGKFSILQGEA